MKRNELRIELLVPLCGRRTSKAKKAALQKWIADTLEDALSNFNGGPGHETHADEHKVGSMILTSEAGVDEVCV